MAGYTEIAEMIVDGPTGPRPRTQMKRSIAEQGLDRSNCSIIRAALSGLLTIIDIEII
jgi:hypothetical protein